MVVSNESINTEKEVDNGYPECQDCGLKDETVFYTSCPYASGVYGEDVPITICPDCYHERCMDI